MTLSPAEVFFQEAQEWQQTFKEAIEAGDRIQAWETCEYARMYADLTLAACALRQIATLENIACEQVGLQETIVNYMPRNPIA